MKATVCYWLSDISWNYRLLEFMEVTNKATWLVVSKGSAGKDK